MFYNPSVEKGVATFSYRGTANPIREAVRGNRELGNIQITHLRTFSS